MKQELEAAVAGIVKDLFDADVDIELTRPDEQFGDYATNVALQLAAKLNNNPREIAETLLEKLQQIEGVEKVEIAGPGFVNLTLQPMALWHCTHQAIGQAYAGQEVLVEYGDPNPFKEMHIGHVYSYIVGDAIARLLEASGAKVDRLSYHGDVGLHVAKAIWGMRAEGVDPASIGDAMKVDIGIYYAKGSKAYEEDENTRDEIHAINEHIYKKDDTGINELYEWGRQKSFGYFNEVLKDLQVPEGKQYFESQTAQVGIDTVRENVGKVFKESDGAIVYDGEKVGLHTRVFITSKGLPTYETKDLGLAELKQRDFPSASRSIIITANEQSEYFKVMLAALAEIDKPLADSITHLSHGFVSLSSGKMSSRTGNVYSGVSAIADIEQAIEKLYPEANQDNRNAAIKYHFLKHRLGSDVVYDVQESFSIEGNSGPYLQYAHARARSILAKAKASRHSEAQAEESQILHSVQYDMALGAEERSLLRKISEYPEVVDKAVTELMPHHVCSYLYELAQKFNSFYEHNRVIGDEREEVRLHLVKCYADTLKGGLELLGITAPEQM
ncbi:MAG TPA: arginine--tRNA ligase [Patescibacteria group bacterium]|nr:arginine--tRNA ligase [Patescibacteria group bacterium]